VVKMTAVEEPVNELDAEPVAMTLPEPVAENVPEAEPVVATVTLEVP
jgi:hypothetical protein